MKCVVCGKKRLENDSVDFFESVGVKSKYPVCTECEKYPMIGDIVRPVGYSGKWEVTDIDYKPDNHNILVTNPDRGEMWISYDAVRENADEE